MLKKHVDKRKFDITDESQMKEYFYYAKLIFTICLQGKLS